MFIVHVRKQIKVLNWGTHRLCAKNQTKHHHHHHNYHITHQPEKPLSKSSWLRLKIYNSVQPSHRLYYQYLLCTGVHDYPKVQTIFFIRSKKQCSCLFCSHFIEATVTRMFFVQKTILWIVQYKYHRVMASVLFITAW